MSVGQVDRPRRPRVYSKMRIVGLFPMSVMRTVNPRISGAKVPLKALD